MSPLVIDPTRRQAADFASALPHIIKFADLWEASLVQKCVHVAARLGIADLLANGDMTADALAAQTGAHPQPLYRVLRLLASHGIFSEAAPRTFRLTPAADCLRSDRPWSLRWDAIDGFLERAGAEIPHGVRTGEAPFAKASGEDFWTYQRRDPDAAEWFNRQMQAQNFSINVPTLLAYDWRGVQTLVDVAGGTGQALGSVLKAHPHLTGVLVDLPHVVDGAPPVLDALGVSQRCRVVAGDMFKAVPAGADTYLLARILHDWSDEDAAAILRVIRAGMPAHGRLLIAEMVVPPGDAAHRSKALDLSMLLLFGGGRERTAEEFTTLLQATGFRLSKIVRSLSPASVIEALAA
jgi:hypothetical protein